MRAGTIRCDKCVYWYNNAVIVGECHINPPGDSGWPISAAEDWCGQFRQPEIVEKKPRANQCNHVYPQIGCSKCMDLYVDVDKDGVLSLHPHKLGMPVPVAKPAPSSCCGGVGCNSCEPGGRG